MYLVHWPIHLNPNGNHPSFPTLPDGKRDVVHSWPLSRTWAQMEAVLAKGKVRAIGVSNCSEKILEQDLLPHAKVVPAVNQIELHLYNPQLSLLKYLKSKGIVAQAYSPLGSTNSPLLSDEAASKIAEERGVKVSDVLLGYLCTSLFIPALVAVTDGESYLIVAKDVVILPKSVNPARIDANLNGAVAAYKALTKEDVEKLDAVAASGKQKRLIMPPWGARLSFPFSLSVLTSVL